MPSKVKRRRRRKAPEDAARTPPQEAVVDEPPEVSKDREDVEAEGKTETEGEGWEAEPEETRPEVMEPVVEVSGEEAPEAAPTMEGVALYRERRVVEEVAEAPRAKDRKAMPTRAQRRALREQRRLEREVDRERRRRENPSWLRSTLAYKTFYDMVCNRVGVIIIGFGVAMILFTISYDWLQGERLSMGHKHWLALVVSLVVYFVGMTLEGLRVLSGECEGLEAQARAQARAAGQGDVVVEMEARGEDGPMPLVPEDAVERFINSNGSEDGGDGGRGQPQGRAR